MIAFAGALRLLAKQSTDLAIHTKPRWPIVELASIDNGVELLAQTARSA
jgi:hypothetical protein